MYFLLLILILILIPYSLFLVLLFPNPPPIPPSASLGTGSPCEHGGGTKFEVLSVIYSIFLFLFLVPLFSILYSAAIAPQQASSQTSLLPYLPSTGRCRARRKKHPGWCESGFEAHGIEGYGRCSRAGRVGTS